MHLILSTFGFCSVLALALFCGFGCGKSSGPMVPISGKVYLGADTVTSGNVTLIPIEDGSAMRALSAGPIKNGEYKIFTDGKEGAPPGKYKITVNPEMVPSSNGKAPTRGWDQKYSDPKNSPLEVELIGGNPLTEHNLILKKSEE